MLTVFSRNARIALVSGTCPEEAVFVHESLVEEDGIESAVLVRESAAIDETIGIELPTANASYSCKP